LREVFGEADPATLKSLRNRMEITRELNLPNGLEIQHRIVALHERYLGADSLDTNRARQLLGKWLMENGKPKAAEPILREVEARFEQTKGYLDPEAFDARGNLAFAIMAQKRFADAVPLYRQLIVESSKIYGIEDHSTLLAENNLAVALYRLGKTDEAEAQLTKVFAVQHRVFGDAYPGTLNTLNNLAVLRTRHGDIAGATTMMRDAYAGTLKAFGKFNGLTRNSGYNLAANLNKLNQPEAAVNVLDDLLQDWDEGQDIALRTKVLRERGIALHLQNKPPAAVLLAFERSWQAATSIHDTADQREAAQEASKLESAAGGNATDLAKWQRRLKQLPSAEKPVASSTKSGK
jgi:tetratricopeptide (TPR) repeat protein